MRGKQYIIIWLVGSLLAFLLTYCANIDPNPEGLSVPISAYTGLNVGKKQWSSCMLTWNTTGTWVPEQAKAVEEAINSLTNAKIYLNFQKNTSAQLTITFAPAAQVGQTNTDGLITYRQGALAALEGSPSKGFTIKLNQAHPWTPAQIKNVVMNQLGELLGLPSSDFPQSVMRPAMKLDNPATAFSSEDIALLKLYYPESGNPVVTSGQPYLPQNAKTHLVEATVTNADNVPPVTSMGYCWSSTNPTPMLQNSEGRNIVSISAGKTQNISLWELRSGTRYYLRAYATNACGESYSNVITFTKP